LHVTVAERWREALAAWAIPQSILDQAPESPWGFEVNLFAHRADSARSQLTVSNERALEGLPEGGVVLDVGCGPGAASLPLARNAGRVIGVDASPRMLPAFRERVQAEGASVETIAGGWPDVARTAPLADVVVCHHVAYNVPDLASFVAELTAHARRRVVMELTKSHPMSRVNDLWFRFHGLVRPSRPTAEDAVAVLKELGLSPQYEEWEGENPAWLAGFARQEDLVAQTRRRLCLPADRDHEIWAAMAGRLIEREGRFSFPALPVVTLWWPGSGV